MKNVVLILLVISLTQIASAQPKSVTGIIKNEAGVPIPGALISEFKSQSNAATYTDSTGFFSLSVGSYPKLNISCKGYNDTLINIAERNGIVVTLSKAKIGKHSTDATSATDDPLINKNLLQDAVSTQSGVNNNYVYGGGVRNYTGSLLPVFTLKEETKGSRYISEKWVHGSVVNANNSVFNDPTYFYNYDKMEGGLLLTHDKQSAIEVDKAQVKSFTLDVGRDNPISFELVPSIDNSNYAEIVSNGNEFKIYKLTKTKFVKSNYQTNGITTSGNPYDEYVDENTYFVLNTQTKQVQKFSLKKKSIKEAFAAEAEQLKDFFGEHSQDEINDFYLQTLGDYLNK